MSTQTATPAAFAPLTPKVLYSQLERCVIADRVPLVLGSPGVGKSSLFRQLAKEFDLKFVDIRLSQMDPTELNGVLAKDDKTNRGMYLPMGMFPLEGDPLPLKPGKKRIIKDGEDVTPECDMYSGWFLLFDELPSVPKAVEAAAYKVILDRLIGQTPLHPNVRMGAAGNQITDGAIAQSIGTATQSRLIHYTLGSHHPDWAEWAAHAGIDHRIQAYLNWKPDSLNNFDPKTAKNDRTFACERTWELLSPLIKGEENLIPLAPTVRGSIGVAMANDFMAYSKLYGSLPTREEIVNSPTTARIPPQHEKGAMFAIAGVVADYLVNDPKVAKFLLQYLLRLPMEFQAIALRQAIPQNQMLMTIPEVAQWAMTNGKMLWGAAA